MHKTPAAPPNRVPESILDYRDRRFIAAEAEVADLTLKRAFAGQPVRPSSLRRIRAALAARGLLDVLPPQPERDP